MNKELSQQADDLPYHKITGLRYAEALPGNAGRITLYLPKHADRPFPVLWTTQGCAWLSDAGHDTIQLGSIAINDAEGYAKALAPAGFAVMAVSVRSSAQAVYPAQLHDSKASVRWLRAHAQEYQLDASRIISIGGSSGGHAAVMLGLTNERSDLEGTIGVTGYSSRINAMVGFFPVTSLLDMDPYNYPGGLELINSLGGGTLGHSDPLSPESRLVGGPITEVPDRAAMASPVHYVDRHAPPLLIAHGTADLNVPWQQSQLLFQKYVEHRRPAIFYLMTNQPHSAPYLDETKNFTSRIVQESTESGIRYPTPHPPMIWETLASWLQQVLQA
jgi:acetyl esterase/lipase